MRRSPPAGLTDRSPQGGEQDCRMASEVFQGRDARVLPCEERGRPANVDPQPLRAEGNIMLNRLYAFTIVTLGTVSEALAQATPPAAPGSSPAPAPADDGSGASWLWIIIGLAIIAAL